MSGAGNADVAAGQVEGERVLQDFAELPLDRQQELGPRELAVIKWTAATGELWRNWPTFRRLLAIQMDKVLREFYQREHVDIGPPRPLSTGETFAELCARLQKGLESFAEQPPFTIQRLCEVLVTCHSCYRVFEKLVLAIEKLLLVSSTVSGPLCTTASLDDLPVKAAPPPRKPLEHPGLASDAGISIRIVGPSDILSTLASVRASANDNSGAISEVVGQAATPPDSIEKSSANWARGLPMEEGGGRSGHGHGHEHGDPMGMHERGSGGDQLPQPMMIDSRLVMDGKGVLGGGARFDGGPSPGGSSSGGGMLDDVVAMGVGGGVGGWGRP
eukprot:jgi/Mesvir1/15609/Mv03216-RA.1